MYPIIMIIIIMQFLSFIIYNTIIIITIIVLDTFDGGTRRCSVTSVIVYFFPFLR